MLSAIVFVLLLIIIGVMGVAIRRLLDQLYENQQANKEYDHYFNLLNKQLKFVILSMKSIDDRGIFEADDEVGVAFTGLKKCTDLLVPFISEEDDEDQA